ncbi:hypothetical protein [Actinoplanes sp. CA-252034]
MAEIESRHQADVAQGDREGFVLVRPDGSLTDEVVHMHSCIRRMTG